MSKTKRIAALIYAMLTLGIVLFQLALALGAPWGAYAMGGAFPGQLPLPMRFVAVVQAFLLLLLAGVVLARAGVALLRWSQAAQRLIWVVVTIAALSLFLNLLTPSAGERMIWAPMALVLLLSSVVVGIE
ncbi:MAG: hypothetical protein KF832_18320 [Caldilineaceae bacterium]|nr:hypothetical protein [Caldilineaceae bacterium]